MTILQAEAILPKQPTDFQLLQASGEFQFRFDDLGIEMEGGFCAGAFNGTAHVTYYNDAEEGLSWFVREIYLDCSKWNGETWEARTIELERNHKLYIELWGALTDDGPWKDSIDARVRENL